MNANPVVDALILAGGQGRRMGGTDKGLLPFDPATSFARALTDLLRPYCRQVLVSCNRNQDQYQAFADQLVADDPPSSQGPLAGIAAASRLSDADFLLITPCDTPDLDARFPQRMLHGLTATSGPRVADDGQRPQVLHLLLPRSLTGSINEYLAQGQHSVKGWLNAWTPDIIRFADCPELFRNINTPEELNAWQQPRRPSREAHR